MTPELKEKELQTEVSDRAERASATRAYVPPVDIYETNDAVFVYADMPGVDKDNIDITLEKKVLTIEGRVKAEQIEEKKTVVHREYNTGDYLRSFTLNDTFDADGIEASINKGVLKVMLPRIKPAKKKIEVR